MARTPGAASNADVQDEHNPSTVTPSRLKKREADRKAQRIAREKTKNRIAHLESLIEELSHRDDNASIVSLKAQLSKVTKQRNKLISCLETSSSLFSKHLTEINELEFKTIPSEAQIQVPSGSFSIDLLQSSTLARSLSAPIPAAPQDAVDNRHLEHLESHLNTFPDESAPDPCQLWTTETLSTDETAVPASLSATVLPTVSSTLELAAAEINFETVNPPGKSSCSCSTSTRTRRLSDGSVVNCNHWKAGNDILAEPLAVSEAMLELEYQVSEDIPVRVVLHGWDSIAQLGMITPMWKKVRQLDEICLSGCGQLERLAMLFMIHLLMRAYADPMRAKSSVVPQWYLKSQLQQLFPLHEPTADYFTWPGVRYRLAITPHRYCHNLFWHLFTEHIRIVWPFDFRDCYVRNIQTGTFNLSPLFKDRLRDLRAWTMEPDFFLQYPELQQDIPKLPAQTFPVGISTRTPENQEETGRLATTLPSLRFNESIGSRTRSASSKDEVRPEFHGGECEIDLLLDDIDMQGDIDFSCFQDAFFNPIGSRDTSSQVRKN